MVPPRDRLTKIRDLQYTRMVLQFRQKEGFVQTPPKQNLLPTYLTFLSLARGAATISIYFWPDMCYVKSTVGHRLPPL